jgi:hypothetical protein
MLIAWPARDSQPIPIDLQITGFVVRSDSGRTAVRLTSHRFRSEPAAEAPYRATA